MPAPTVEIQRFKHEDAVEEKFHTIFSGALALIDAEKDEFWDARYECAPLGDVIWNEQRSPLANAIKLAVFRDAFQEIFTSFQQAGTAEAYMAVFQKIFGDEVGITFTVPAPGKLNVDIVAEGIELSPWITREIVDNQYENNNVVDDEDDNIAFQTIKGFQTEYELQQMLFEMVTNGIYTTITLTLG